MQPAARAVFVASYSGLVASVWADPIKERLMAENPRALLAEHGLTVPDHVTITIVRDTSEEPDLESQVRAWENAVDSGNLLLVIPATEPIQAGELAEDELDVVVAGLDATCSCCCPCSCNG